MFSADSVSVDSGREDKAKWFFNEYHRYLANSSILDVGCDQGYLRHLIDPDSRYYGVGNRGAVDQIVDLEVDLLPFKTASFDCVLCLDVLEHVENIHEIFDELCRVTRRHVILSLPNPYCAFWDMLRAGEYAPDTRIHYHNLPVAMPEDRHKWFFCISEARRFVETRAAACGMAIVASDVHQFLTEGRGIKRLIRKLARKILIPTPIPDEDLFGRTLWVVMQKDVGA